MLSLLNHTLAMVITLALLCLALVGPFVVLWIALSMRRDLHRIADALEIQRIDHDDLRRSYQAGRADVAQAGPGRISTSAFGR